MPDGAADRRPCQRQRVSASSLHPVQGSSRRLEVWHRVNPTPSTRRGSPAAGARRAEPLTATAVSLFGLSPDNQ
nr:MAG TPA: hypothetical protein [Caudoviricetes sp.]